VRGCRVAKLAMRVEASRQATSRDASDFNLSRSSVLGSAVQRAAHLG
jgi:hypothetical protein